MIELSNYKPVQQQENRGFDDLLLTDEEGTTGKEASCTKKNSSENEVVPSKTEESTIQGYVRADYSPGVSTRRKIVVAFIFVSSLLLTLLIESILRFGKRLVVRSSHDNNDPFHPDDIPDFPEVLELCHHETSSRIVNGPWDLVGNMLDRDSAIVNGGVWEDHDEYNASVALNANASIVAVGFPGFHASHNRTLAGMVQVYRSSVTTTGELQWVPMGRSLKGHEANDLFGTSVALSGSGTVLVVGAPQDGNASVSTTGYINVFEWKGNDWIRMGQQPLTMTLPLSSDHYNIHFDDDSNSFLQNSSVSQDAKVGYRVGCSYDGYTIAVAGTGMEYPLHAVEVYWYTVRQWIMQDHLLFGSEESNDFSLSADGSSVAISGYNDASVYRLVVDHYNKMDYHVNQGMRFKQVGETVGGWEDSLSVALNCDGTMVAVGYSHNDADTVRVFRYDYFPQETHTTPLATHYRHNWTQIHKDIVVPGGTLFGGVIALSHDGMILAVGAPKEGQVILYHCGETQWERVGFLKGQEGFYGSSIALSFDGSTMALIMGHESVVVLTSSSNS